MRIDLASDVLFDFDKADLLPKAQQTLSQAADIIRHKAKGSAALQRQVPPVKNDGRVHDNRRLGRSVVRINPARFRSLLGQSPYFASRFRWNRPLDCPYP